LKQVLKPITLIILLGNFGLLWAQQALPAGAQMPGDNAKVNQRDRDKTAPTADQRKDKSDRELATGGKTCVGDGQVAFFLRAQHLGDHAECCYHFKGSSVF